MANRHYGVIALSGGSPGYLDEYGIDFNNGPASQTVNLETGDSAQYTTSQGVDFYIFDKDGTDAQNLPYVIRPNDYATNGPGVWRKHKGTQVKNYINGIVITTTNTTTVTLGAGECMDSTGLFLMQFAGDTMIITTSGAGGLDTGTVAASTMYHVFVIYNPTTKAYDTLMSLSLSAPTLPSGYTYFRKIGSLRVNSSSQVVPSFQVGAGNIRIFRYLVPAFRLLTSGSATTPTQIDCSDYVPYNAISMLNTIICSATTPNNYFYVRPDIGGDVTSGFLFYPNPPASFDTKSVETICSGSPAVYYHFGAAGGSLWFDVVGYTEEV